jgi:glycosyltransferase involved in cell wall biosynthesis
MFCSTIIPTIGRSTLMRAVQSILDQSFQGDDFEIIVVNDSGSPLAPAAWQQSEKVRVLNTNRHERCVARNAGAAIAKGDYLHFLDDDDWLWPDAFKNFWKFTQTAQASWIYGATQLVDREGKSIINLHHNLQGNCFIQLMAGEWLPLQSSLIESKAFFAVGGFNPTIPGAEDIDLARRVALAGDVAGMQMIVSSVGMGEENSTTNYGSSLLLARWAREDIMSQANAFKRMRQSANNAYWNGRIIRAYLTSAVWNLQQLRLTTTFSRSLYALASLILTVSHFPTKSYWQAISKSHESQVFLQGFATAEQPIQRRVIATISKNL